MAIFKTEKKLKKYLSKASNDKRLNILSLNLKYPFFILENSRSKKRFTYHKESKDLNVFINKNKLKDVIIYTISKDYQPKKLGADEMGRLNHNHL